MLTKTTAGTRAMFMASSSINVSQCRNPQVIPTRPANSKSITSIAGGWPAGKRRSCAVLPTEDWARRWWPKARTQSAASNLLEVNASS